MGGIKLWNVYNLRAVTRFYLSSCVICVSDTRLHDFQIGYLDDWPTGALDPSSYTLCATYCGVVGNGATESVNCDTNNSGRYVVVQIPGSNERLTLCEVKVFVNV